MRKLENVTKNKETIPGEMKECEVRNGDGVEHKKH